MTVEAVWAMSDNPDDPCAYCVVWQEADDDPMGERARPIWPDGSVAPLIYRGVHRQCWASVEAYIAEVHA